MIVNKPISVKIGNMVSRLTVGKQVPAEVLEFWEKTGQLDDLKKAQAILEEKEQKTESPMSQKGSNKSSEKYLKAE